MTDEIFKELCKLLDYYQSKGLMSHYNLNNAIRCCSGFISKIKDNPRYKTSRTFEMTWSISGDLIKELYQHHAYDGDFHIGEFRHYRRHLHSPISSYEGLRKFFEKYL